MMKNPKRAEIDQRTIKLIVGLIALSLASLTSLFSMTSITSISASYYQGDWPRNIFVGCLFSIATFLLSYNGLSWIEWLLAKIAALAAIGVAMFPCGCDGYQEIIEGVHGGSAAVMFIVLAAFCYIFFARARGKSGGEAKLRAAIYAVCGLVIVAAILVLGYEAFSGGRLSARIPRLTFYGERAGLVAFGICWLLASHVLPLVTSRDERVSLFR